jgi:hypothetical protein
MPKKSSREKQPDFNELAFSIVEQATSSEPEQPDEETTDTKDPELSNRGRKGGKSRARKLSAQERSESARKAAMARWHKHQRNHS